MKSKEIRQSFFDFFISKNHKIVSSAPVIPHGDPTLFFTNAGMNQFKKFFLNEEKPTSLRVADTQKCIRVSGKHNDLEEVGRDTFHHTLFEMLGNWSFGDYYKKEAIRWAWELLTEVWKLPKERLWATVYKTDDEAMNFWKSETDINPTHILKFDEKDNFWEMGETGPCGPCSEIHIDLSPKGNLDASLVNSGSPLLIEIWNLVFIQNNRKSNGELENLPAKHVDTGMGFERVCSVFDAMENKFQKFPSNYDTDVFTLLISKISELTKMEYGANEQVDISHRVIADHIRALSFAIADGAIPSNEGRGYVLRRILRRASKFGRNLNQHEPFIYKLVETLSNQLGDIFPELKIQKSHIEKIIKTEEESFNKTLDKGLEIFDSTLKNLDNSKIFPGNAAFKLYDTFGFPLDLTQLLCNEQNIELDIKGFNEEMELQKIRARNASSGKFQFTSATLDIPTELQENIKTEFNGYKNNFTTKSKIIYANENILALDKTPLYAEGGGQISDTGEIIFGDSKIKVLDSKKGMNGIYHYIETNNLNLKIGDEVTAIVDIEKRNSIMKNHSAAHLLHSALRNILGTHVHQAGSFVGEEYFRFDFAHFQKVTNEEIKQIESFVNEKILEASILQHHLNIPIEEAKKMGALMFFGDKYGEKVNVVQFGNYSIEFCGGTHTDNTKNIEFFKIKKEESISSGVRRIEAVTENYALKLLELKNKSYKEQIESSYNLLDEIEDLLQKIKNEDGNNSEIKNINFNQLDIDLRKLEEIPSIPSDIINSNLSEEFNQQENRFLNLENFYISLTNVKKNLSKIFSKYIFAKSLKKMDELINNSIEKNGFKILSGVVEAEDIEMLKQLGEHLKQKITNGVGLLVSVNNQKVSLVCFVSDNLIENNKLNASKIISEVAKLVNGGGGGKPHLATAGGKDVSKIYDAINHFNNLF